MIYVALATVVLAYHVWVYYFLCDDAFISFRYARNAIDGAGLVFNRGEAVEGYTNFLWVLELALMWLLGVRPETSSIVLSLLFTAGTFAVMIAIVCHLEGGRRRGWVLCVALALWVTNRSVAVWSTSGLETRQFTFLVVFAAYAALRGRYHARWLWGASMALALAEYTRPEALMLWACVVGWYVFDAWLHRRLTWRGVFGLVTPFAVLVAAHLLFRNAYYGELLPNTYYAKHIRPWPDQGLRYFKLATLEYGLYLIVPLAIVDTVSRFRMKRNTCLLLAWALVIPHVLYLMRIGGDHFEFRPLDLYWPLIYIAAAGGIVTLADRAHAAAKKTWPAWSRPVRCCAAGGLTLLCLLYGTFVSLAEYHSTKHLNTRAETLRRPPIEESRSGFAFLLPGMPTIISKYNRLLANATAQFVGTRHVEHKAFALHQMAGWSAYERHPESIPAGAVMATPSVGIVPFYLPELTVIDTLGLTDKTVARHGRVRPNKHRMMAHDRSPPPGYLEKRGVNIDILPVAKTREQAFRRTRFAVELEPGMWMPVKSRNKSWLREAYGDQLQTRLRRGRRPR